MSSSISSNAYTAKYKVLYSGDNRYYLLLCSLYVCVCQTDSVFGEKFSKLQYVVFEVKVKSIIFYD